MTALSSHPNRGNVTLILKSMPNDLVHHLQRVADRSNRTLEAQVIHMLVCSLAVEDRLAQASGFIQELFREHEGVINHT